MRVDSRRAARERSGGGTVAQPRTWKEYVRDEGRGEADCGWASAALGSQSLRKRTVYHWQRHGGVREGHREDRTLEVMVVRLGRSGLDRRRRRRKIRAVDVQHLEEDEREDERYRRQVDGEQEATVPLTLKVHLHRAYIEIDESCQDLGPVPASLVSHPTARRRSGCRGTSTAPSPSHMSDRTRSTCVSSADTS